MAGARQVAGAGARVDERLDGGRAVEGRDAGARALTGVDGDGERGAVRLGVVADHQRQLELVEAVAGHGHADHTRRVAQEEGDLVGRGRLRGHDQVSLVLPVGVVDDDDDVAPPDGGDRVFDPGERHGYS